MARLLPFIGNPPHTKLGCFSPILGEALNATQESPKMHRVGGSHQKIARNRDQWDIVEGG